MGLRFRSELQKVATVSFTVGTTVIVPTTALVGIQRAGIYRVALNSAAGSTFQFQDTGTNNISAVYTMPANGFAIFDLANNFDPWWQATAALLGLQIVTSATVTGDIYWAAGA